MIPEVNLELGMELFQTMLAAVYNGETQIQQSFADSLEEFVFAMYEYQKEITGKDYFEDQFASSYSSDRVQVLSPEPNFEIWTVQEVSQEEELEEDSVDGSNLLSPGYSGVNIKKMKPKKLRKFKSYDKFSFPKLKPEKMKKKHSQSFKDTLKKDCSNPEAEKLIMTNSNDDNFIKFEIWKQKREDESQEKILIEKQKKERARKKSKSYKEKLFKETFSIEKNKKIVLSEKTADKRHLTKPEKYSQSNNLNKGFIKIEEINQKEKIKKKEFSIENEIDPNLFTKGKIISPMETPPATLDHLDWTSTNFPQNFNLNIEYKTPSSEFDNPDFPNKEDLIPSMEKSEGLAGTDWSKIISFGQQLEEQGIIERDISEGFNSGRISADEDSDYYSSKKLDNPNPESEFASHPGSDKNLPVVNFWAKKKEKSLETIQMKLYNEKLLDKEEKPNYIDLNQRDPISRRSSHSPENSSNTSRKRSRYNSLELSLKNTEFKKPM